jgi:hypothetical protein
MYANYTFSFSIFLKLRKNRQQFCRFLQTILPIFEPPRESKKVKKMLFKNFSTIMYKFHRLHTYIRTYVHWRPLRVLIMQICLVGFLSCNFSLINGFADEGSFFFHCRHKFSHQKYESQKNPRKPNCFVLKNVWPKK